MDPAEEAKDPGYWAKQLRSCVRFGAGVERVAEGVGGAAGGGAREDADEAGAGERCGARSGAGVEPWGTREGVDENGRRCCGRWGGCGCAGREVGWEKVQGGPKPPPGPPPHLPLRPTALLGRARNPAGVRRDREARADVSLLVLSSLLEVVGAARFAGERGSGGDVGTLAGAGRRRGPARPSRTAATRRRGRSSSSGPAAGWRGVGRDTFTLRPGSPEDYRALVARLGHGGVEPARVGSFTPGGAAHRYEAGRRRAAASGSRASRSGAS